MPTKMLYDERGNMIVSQQQQQQQQPTGNDNQSMTPSKRRHVVASLHNNNTSYPPPSLLLSSGCSTPLTIIAALRHYRHHAHPHRHLEDTAKNRGQQQQEQQKKRGIIIDTAVDIIGVVLSLSLDLYEKTADILLIDPSLPLHTCAKVRLRGSDDMKRVTSHRIERGDILRFHHVSVARDYGYNVDEDLEEKMRDVDVVERNVVPMIYCEFRHDGRSPVAGASFAKLNQSPWEILERGGDGNGVRNGDNVPPGMVTPPDMVSGLLDWWRRREQKQCRLSVSSGLPISSRRRRRLCDITTANLLSDVLVRILAVDRHNFLPSSPNKRRWKRRRDESPSHSYCLTLSDGAGSPEDMMGLWWAGCADLLINKAERMMREGRKVLITGLLSRELGEGGGEGGVILESTNDTEMMDGCCDEEQDNDYEEGRTYYSERGEDRDKRGSMVISAKITKLTFDDGFVLSKQTSTTSPDEMINSLLVENVTSKSAMGDRSNPKQYTNLTVDLNDCSHNDVLTKTQLCAKADSQITMTLCGSLTVEELMEERETLIPLVVQIMLGLICEDVDLIWTIERRYGGDENDDGCWMVTNVSLKEL